MRPEPGRKCTECPHVRVLATALAVVAFVEDCPEPRLLRVALEQSAEAERFAAAVEASRKRTKIVAGQQRRRHLAAVRSREKWESTLAPAVVIDVNACCICGTLLDMHDDSGDCPPLQVEAVV